MYIYIHIYIYIRIYIYDISNTCTYCICICIYILYICIYIYISGHRWSTTQRVLKSHKSKMSIIYMLSWKQCALSVITTMTFWQLMHLGTWHTSCIYIYTYICIYIYVYIYIYIYWELKIFLGSGFLAFSVSRMGSSDYGIYW